MQKTNKSHQKVEAHDSPFIETTPPPLHHEWPLLGRALYLLELELSDIPVAGGQGLSGRKEREIQEALRSTIMAQLYADEGSHSRDSRYLAFLSLKAGRGGVIVGNPYALSDDGKPREMPYTGLEGYYAGSQSTAELPGMTAREILLEEASVGVELLKHLKRQAIDDYSWASFAHLQHVLAEDNPDPEAMRTLQLYWSTIVKRFHVRIYHNPEFALTLPERIRQVEREIGESAGSTEEERRVKKDAEARFARLKEELNSMSEVEQERQWQETKRRECIRAQRLAAFHRFREETYRLLDESGQGHYAIGIQDTSLEQATVVETVTLPTIPDRKTYPRVDVHFTPEQYEGYLFLTKLGELGGDPLARSVAALPQKIADLW
ncbi:MAG TPA: hypothetical protein VFQ30_08785 [Ktedonobacteraceae bacterium]|nr:hypothetical protein [Ktedonobacteraceae bacterium]